MSAHKLKELQVRRTKLKAEYDTLVIERKEKIKACDALADKLMRLDREIANFSKEPMVSEHALLRYFEREMGYDLEIIKGKILTDQNKSMIKTLISGKFPFGKNKLVVKDMVVVSIAP